ncbi:MAG TPA: hypothetical protein VHH73_13745 [Verrucomicrobiae bacterium]|nr:hypothetical protein [Verrucomicrobiae bacterium]
MKKTLGLLAIGAALVAAGCGRDNGDMTSPSVATGLGGTGTTNPAAVNDNQTALNTNNSTAGTNTTATNTPPATGPSTPPK